LVLWGGLVAVVLWEKANKWSIARLVAIILWGGLVLCGRLVAVVLWG
jgi:hypothetical protein